MKYVVFLWALISLACTGRPGLSAAWSAENLGSNPESVAWDSVNERFVVSIIGGAPTSKDGNGALVLVGIDGSPINLNWSTGLDAPKGVVVEAGKVFATDIDKIRVIDSSTGALLSTLEVHGASFLNDLTLFGGALLVTDSDLGQVFSVPLNGDSEISKWAEVPGSNGILLLDETVVVGGSAGLFYFDKSGTIQKTVPVAGGTDGLGVFNGFLVRSDFNGRLFIVDSNGKETPVEGFPIRGKNAADLTIVPEKGLLAVATFRGGTLDGYILK